MKDAISKQIKQSNASVEKVIQQRREDVVRKCMKKGNESGEKISERRRKE